MKVLIALCALLAVPCGVAAAVVEVTPMATLLINPDFSPIDVQPAFDVPVVRLPAREEPYLIQVDVRMRIRDLQPGQVGFSNTAFNGAVHGDGTIFVNSDLGVPAWWPDNPTWNNWQLWDINSDDGVSNDLQSVILAGVTRGFGPPQFDLRRTLGQSEEGEHAGIFFVTLPATPGASMLAETLTPWGASTYDENGFSTTAGNTAIGGRTQTFVVVPEPSSIALLAMAALAITPLLRRRVVRTMLFLVTCLGLAASCVQAAVVEVTPTATAILNSTDFTPIDLPVSLDSPLVRLPPREEPYLIQVEVSMWIHDLQPGQVGFSNTAFNIDVAGGGQLYIDSSLGIPAWMPENPDLSPNPLPPSILLWEMNGDNGVNQWDGKAILLAGITKGFFPFPWDRRRTLGQDPDGERAGSFFVLLPGTPGATAYAETLTPWGASTYDENGFSTTAGNTAIGGRTQTFVVVPEPSSIALLAMTALAITPLLRRRVVRTMLFLVTCLGLAASCVQAAVVEVTPTATAILNSTDFTPIDLPVSLEGPLVRLPAREEPYLIQIDVTMRIRDLLPGQVGFSNTAFNGYALGDGAIFRDPSLGIPSWVPNNPAVDRTGSSVGNLYLWDMNVDAGNESDDLRAVILAGVTRQFFAPPGSDPRQTLGQGPAGTLAGFSFLLLPGTPGASASFETTTPWGASTYDENGFSTTAGNTAIGGRTQTFIVVPEPATFALAISGVMFAILIAKR